MTGTGVRELVYMSDQEMSLSSVLKRAVNKLTIAGVIVRAASEASAVGESQSNGLAERGRATCGGPHTYIQTRHRRQTIQDTPHRRPAVPFDG